MRKTWVVIRREFLERVRNKWFVIATVLGPVLLGVAMFLPAFLLTRSTSQNEILIVDVGTTRFAERVTQILGSTPRMQAERYAVPLADLERTADSLVAIVGAKELDGFLILTDQTVVDGKAEYRGSNVSSQIDMATVRRVVQEAVLTERLEQVGIDPGVVAQARIPVDLRTVNIRGGELTDQTGEAAFFMAYVMWFILYFAILVYGVQVAGAVVEEKSSRVVEVLVSSLKPFELLAGKVIGVGAVGLFQLSIWAIVARILIDRQETILKVFGVDVPSGGGVVAIPEIPLDTIGVLLLYFVLGFFLYATMFAAVGAMSSTESEMRQAQQPIVILVVIPALLAFGALNEPDGTLATVLTLVPLSSPIAMPMRWAVSAVPITELLLSVAILVATSVLVTWLAGRIYRVGILMYGKRPSVRELLRWVRA